MPSQDAGLSRRSLLQGAATESNVVIRSLKAKAVVPKDNNYYEMPFEVQADGPWPESHLATDTKTGRLCRTWDWEQPNNFWHITRENTRTCASLAQQ